jgi:hypothetical protein
MYLLARALQVLPIRSAQTHLVDVLRRGRSARTALIIQAAIVTGGSGRNTILVAVVATDAFAARGARVWHDFLGFF